MSDTYEALSWRQNKDGKWFATRLGRAIKRKQGDGYMVYLDAIPASTDGQYVITLSPPKPKGENQAAPKASDDGAPF